MAPASEVVKVERHLRELARAMAFTRTAVTVRDAGEITWKTRHQRGQYGGGSDYLIVNDGRVTAASIAKLLGAAPPPDPRWRDRR
ncbi:MAG TPA: hypothetical protein VN133_09860, partial [Humibacter sp.]|nr:hypothetical protein [Humibacter sp.]